MKFASSGLQKAQRPRRKALLSSIGLGIVMFLLALAKSASLSSEPPEPRGLAAFAASRGWPAGSIVFLTLSDSHYAHNILNSAHALRDHQYLVVCMDAECLTLCHKHSVAAFGESIGKSVGAIKFGAVRELLEGGFHTLLFDMDLFILKDPLDAMLPLRDPWDVQIQGDVNAGVNIGWVLSRATPAVADLWHEVEEGYAASGLGAENDDNAYQGQVMFGHKLAESGLQVNRLGLAVFRSWMFEDKKALYEEEGLGNETAILHFTCSSGAYKNHIAKCLGLFHEALGYYCAARPTLELDVLAWSGSQEQLTQRLAFAVQAAHDTGRAFVTPKWARVEHGDGGDVYKVPFSRAFDLHSPPLRAIEVLEHNYFKSQRRECGTHTPPVHLPPTFPTSETIEALMAENAARLVLHLNDTAPAGASFEAPRPCNVEVASWGWECLQDCP